MGEHVAKAGQRRDSAHRQPVARAHPVGGVGVLGQFGQALQATPDAGGRAPLQQHRAVGENHREASAALPGDFLRPGCGQIGHAAVLQGHAGGGQRAAGAGRAAAGAHGGAQIHLGLGVNIHVACRQQALSQLPHGVFHRLGAREALDAEGAGQHPLHVAVEDRRPRAITEGADRRRGRAADARQFGQQGRIGRKHPAVPAHHRLGALVQVAGPGVVAQAAPQGEHVLHRRGGQAGQIGKAFEKAPVIRNHRVHLGLLEHDFR